MHPSGSSCLSLFSFSRSILHIRNCISVANKRHMQQAWDGLVWEEKTQETRVQRRKVLQLFSFKLYSILDSKLTKSDFFPEKHWLKNAPNSGHIWQYFPLVIFLHLTSSSELLRPLCVCVCGYYNFMEEDQITLTTTTKNGLSLRYKGQTDLSITVGVTAWRGWSNVKDRWK